MSTKPSTLNPLKSVFEKMKRSKSTKDQSKDKNAKPKRSKSTHNHDHKAGQPPIRSSLTEMNQDFSDDYPLNRSNSHKSAKRIVQLRQESEEELKRKKYKPIYLTRAVISNRDALYYPWFTRDYNITNWIDETILANEKMQQDREREKEEEKRSSSLNSNSTSATNKSTFMNCAMQTANDRLGVSYRNGKQALNSTGSTSISFIESNLSGSMALMRCSEES